MLQIPSYNCSFNEVPLLFKKCDCSRDSRIEKFANSPGLISFAYVYLNFTSTLYNMPGLHGPHFAG